MMVTVKRRKCQYVSVLKAHMFSRVDLQMSYRSDPFLIEVSSKAPRDPSWNRTAGMP